MNNLKPSHILQPTGGEATEILRTSASGKPLSADQINFLDLHYKQLSSATFDPVLKYYLQRYTGENRYHASFLLPHELINHEAIEQLKKRLKLFLQDKSFDAKKPAKKATISITQKQFMDFKALNINELIFWHGNQFLTGAPMFPGGTPPVIFLQWGNFFGVVKYVVLAEEKALKSNLLIYFEDRHERELDECVQQYMHRLENEKIEQRELLLTHKIKPEEFSEYLIKAPILRKG